MVAIGSRGGGGGGGSSNLLLAAIVALTAYAPFEWIAKATLIVSIYMFVVDPIPPLTRVLSILSTLCVFALTKWYKKSLADKEKEEAIQMVSVVEGEAENDQSVAEKKKDK